MKLLNKCLNCSSKKLVSFPATISPFLIEMMKFKIPKKVELKYCLNCDLAFYNPRPSEKELSLLYSHYRDSHYQKTREKYEKYYTKEFNSSIGKSKSDLKKQTIHFLKTVKNFIKKEQQLNVLDFGGDKGHFLANTFKLANKYVYEVSKVQPLTGIKKFSTISSINKKFDFILCRHVLEHVSNPQQIIRRIKSISQKDTIFYFEVPIEFPINYFSIKFTKIILFPIITMGLSLKIFKPFFIKHRFYFLMHEHLNKFCVNSITNMLAKENLKIIRIHQYQNNKGWSKPKVFCCLAKSK